MTLVLVAAGTASCASGPAPTPSGNEAKVAALICDLEDITYGFPENSDWSAIFYKNQTDKFRGQADYSFRLTGPNGIKKSFAFATSNGFPTTSIIELGKDGDRLPNYETGPREVIPFFAFTVTQGGQFKYWPNLPPFDYETKARPLMLFIPDVAKQLWYEKSVSMPAELMIGRCNSGAKSATP